MQKYPGESSPHATAFLLLGIYIKWDFKSGILNDITDPKFCNFLTCLIFSQLKFRLFPKKCATIFLNQPTLIKMFLCKTFYWQVVFREISSENFRFARKVVFFGISVAIFKLQSFKKRIITVKIYHLMRLLYIWSQHMRFKKLLEKRETNGNFSERKDRTFLKITETFQKLCCKAFSVKWRIFINSSLEKCLFTRIKIFLSAKHTK